MLDTKTEPKIGIDQAGRKTVTHILNTLLADQHVLYIKTRNYHWNLVGGRFHALHVHFEQLYTDLASIIDKTAERIRMIGGVPSGSMAEFSGAAGLKEVKGQLIEGDAALQNLLNDHELMIQSLRNYAEIVDNTSNDAGTEDFLIGLLQQHEMMAWMLRSYLQSK